MLKSLILLTTCYLLLTTLFVSCDKIKAPYTDDNNGTTDTISCPLPEFTARQNYQRHILVEEFTGFKCVNCPRGHKMLDSLNNVYGNKLITYSIHAKGYFTNPDPSGNFTYDFRSVVGNDLDTKFKIAIVGLPDAMINRVSYGNTKAVSPDNWGPYIDADLLNPPQIDIQIMNDYDVVSKKLCIHTRVHPLEDIKKQVNLSVYIVEDSIQASQLDINSSVLLNYVHRNVLRDAVNGTYGEQLKDTLLVKDEYITKSYKYFLKDSWNYKQIYVIAFVYYQDSYEIIQSEKIKISN